MLNYSVPLEQLVTSLEKAMPDLGDYFRRAMHAGIAAGNKFGDVLNECMAAVVGPGIIGAGNLERLTEKWNG